MRTFLSRKLRTPALLLTLLYTLQAQAQLQIKTEVYPGVELLNVIHLLSDSVETVQSTYTKDVKEYFKAYKDHPAVQKARELALINCDFPLRHAWCFYNFPEIKLHEPDTLGAYNKYVSTAALKDYFRSCIAFYRDSRFWEFYKTYQPVYARWISSFNRNLYEAGMLASIDSFYRLKPAGRAVFTLGPMNCNSFALSETGSINPVYKGISTILIAYGNLGRSADTSSPDFYRARTSQMIWHEAGHVFLADLFRKYAKQVEAVKPFFDRNENMKKQAGTIGWALYLDENITQAVTSYLRIHTGRAERTAELDRISNGGYYVLSRSIIAFMEKEYLGTNKYRDFDAFFPVLLAELGRQGF
jgi:hypothetical protein